jgi:membrane-associated phospholipid phosphatase
VRKLEAIAGVTLALVVVGGVVPCRAQSAPDPVAQPEAVQADAPESQPAAAGPGPLAAAAARAQDFDPQPGSETANVFDVPKDRRTMSAFPKNLGRNFIGVFSGSNLVPFAVGAGMTTLASAFDGQTEHSLKGVCSVCGQTGARIGGGLMAPMVTMAFLAGRFAPEGRFRSMTYDFMQAAIVNLGYTEILKYSVKRERPDGSDSLSFPSGHTSTAFSLATVAEQHYGWKVGVPAYALASCIGLTRIEQDRHHLSDVVAGATIGVIVGRTVTRLDGQEPGRKRTLALAPATDPHGQGVGLALSGSW